ncbi:class I SAM-dependent methyltransferase [Myxococcus sp. RHSTA-1-4]|uniref:class I SAM-dependent methyltransferase n=1 Tax=Myxococcus sp. RHSTA-1-4 TaxID=2874601 RepID=UPI001CC19C1F|nr:class I SAM-dependent methyltransferase [Myxococcus sp. RHSTA-1-4]MBZ4423174.1 class I SAM-dependent methyltransferase [Myxococcus sp. RHSTA-1-4]
METPSLELEVSPEVHAGQAVYTRWTLRLLYDVGVLGYSNRFVWKCPTPTQLEWYNANVSANHLDVGVGTGYYVARCRYPAPSPRLALMDLNANSLERAASRAARYSPETYRRNVLDPIGFDAPRFDSIGLNYLLHCLPGSMDEKAVVFDHLRSLLNPGGCLFGSTLLQGDVPRSAQARLLMRLYNRKGIFSNQEDTLESLERALHTRFKESQISLHGCVALFRARA